jgi:uncharacterized RDD family membrane protein YckC
VRDVYAIRTPENVSFDFELAGVASRAVAWTIDGALLAAGSMIGVFVAGMLGVVLGGVASALYLVFAFLLQWGYGALCEWRLRGQTIGKRIVGIRVLQLAGVRPTLVQCVVRNLVRIVDVLPLVYLAGGLCALFDRHGRRLGDLAAGTIVVRQRRSPRPSAIAAAVERHNSFAHDPAVVHASTRISAQEREAMVALALRRDQLPLPVRQALFAKLARHLQAELALARPAYLSDERFVLNLATIVLGQTRGAAAAVGQGER